MWLNKTSKQQEQQTGYINITIAPKPFVTICFKYVQTFTTILMLNHFKTILPQQKIFGTD